MSAAEVGTATGPIHADAQRADPLGASVREVDPEIAAVFEVLGEGIGIALGPRFAHGRDELRGRCAGIALRCPPHPFLPAAGEGR